MTPENQNQNQNQNQNRPDPNRALMVFIEAGRVLTDKTVNENDTRLACIAMLSTFAFMRGQSESVNVILKRKGEN